MKPPKHMAELLQRAQELEMFRRTTRERAVDDAMDVHGKYCEYCKVGSLCHQLEAIRDLKSPTKGRGHRK